MNAVPSVVVAGAGVFGTAIALRLARAGARVTLADPAGVGDNASGVAAGMVAPAFEALLDPMAAGHFSLLRASRDLWPAFVGEDGLGALGLRRCGAVWLTHADDSPDQIETHRAGLAALGAAAEPWTAAEVAARVPGLDAGIGAGLFTSEDWRLAPIRALAALRAAAYDAGAAFVMAAVTGFEPGRAWMSDGERIAADRLVVATGANPAGLAPELALLSPIKGHILRYADARLAASGPTLRRPGGYAAGGADGLVIGSTMEPGRADRTIDPAMVQPLAALARSLFPALADAPFTPQAAARATSPDGGPLVGPSERVGVFIAVGARRNGWLLAPLVSQIIEAHLVDGDPGPWASALAPQRL
jgi:glycine oxidase